MSVLDLFNLSGKTALVTGCRRGIGKAMALALAQSGADIVGVSVSLEPTGSRVEKEVGAGPIVSGVPLRLRRPPIIRTSTGIGSSR